MDRHRSFYESDRVEQMQQPTRYMTAMNRNEVYCGMCGETFFLDNSRFATYQRTFEQTLENPFMCQKCECEFDEATYS